MTIKTVRVDLGTIPTKTLILYGITASFELPNIEITHETIPTRYSEIADAVTNNRIMDQCIRESLEHLDSQGVFHSYGPFTLNIADLIILQDVHRVHSLHYSSGKVSILYDKAVSVREPSV